MKHRFRETGQTIYEFIDHILVHCPRCDECAEVILRNPDAPRKYRVDIEFAPRRLVCKHCGYSKDWHGRQVIQYQEYDWYFHQPLWLRIPCCGDILWAHNEKHLNFLADFVKAELRESYPNGTLASRLPT